MSTERNDLIHQAKANSKIKIGIVCCRAIIGKTKIWNKTKPAKRSTNKKKEVDEERCEKEGTISLCIYFMNEGLLYTFTLQYIDTFEYSKCIWKIKYLQIHIFIVRYSIAVEHAVHRYVFFCFKHTFKHKICIIQAQIM